MNSVKKREVQNTRIKDTQPGDKHSKDRKTGITEAEMPRRLQAEHGWRGGGGLGPPEKSVRGRVGTQWPEEFESDQNL